MSPPRNPAARASQDDAASIAARYARRAAGAAARDDALRPEVQHWLAERRAAVARSLHRAGWATPGSRRAVEVGCGAGGNLGMLIDAGFAPRHLAGIDLLAERVAAARSTLPPEVRLEVGDARQIDIAPGSVDLVLQFTVFSSLLEDRSRAELAAAMWRWLAPGGAILSYDFVVAAVGAAHVRALPLRALRALFPQGTVRHVERLTLAPPLARAAARLHPSLVSALDTLPWLRTHRLVWIDKGGAA